MDSSREAVKAVQHVVSPSLLGSLMEPSPDWLCPPQLMLCVEGLEEEPFNYEATPETDELLLLASQAVELMKAPTYRPS